MKFCIILTVALLECQALRYDDPIVAFEEFKITHNKFYPSPSEENRRFQIFKDSLYKVIEHNQQYDAGIVKYTIEINRFSDLTFEEFSIKYLNKYDMPDYNDENLYVPTTGYVRDAVDWRKENAVADVKDQGNCGSCWSFSATGALEGQLAIKTKRLVPLSEQNLIDCSWNYNNSGCISGNVVKAFNYVRDYGITSEEKYPYDGYNNPYCYYNEADKVMSITGYKVINSEDALLSAVSEIGPVSVGIATYQDDDFHRYKHGILHGSMDESCKYNLNHAVLVVGYGTENGEDYWIVKNSWGVDWNDKGYLKMIRNRNVNCIAAHGVYPVL